MKNILIAKAIIAVLFISILSGCEVTQTKETELPDVDVDVDAGQLPAFDVDWADVDVGTTTKTLKVPKLVVVMEEVDFEVPYVDIDMPNEDGTEREERTIAVEIEVEKEAHELQIQEIYGKGDQLIVVSKLDATGDDIGDQKMRVSDRVIVKAGDLNVKHYIIGARPEGDWNRQYKFIASRNAISTKLDGAQQIYSR